MTVSLHRHRHPTAEVRHVQDQQPEQIAAGTDGAGNGETPNPRMVAKESFNNILLSNKTSRGSLYQKRGPFTLMIVSAD